MVRRQQPERPSVEVRQFTSIEIDRGMAKLHRRIDEVRAIDPQKIRHDDARIGNIQRSIRETIREVFGQRSPEFDDLQYHRIWHGGLNYLDSPAQRQAKFAAGIPQTVTILEGLISRLEEKREDTSLGDATSNRGIASTTGTRRVFVVHGHDEAAKEAVARFLLQLDLEPVILHEQANKGRTVIEKFEVHTDVDFAVILLTPDDVGRADDGSDEPRARARQNVIFELGYFIGKLGRSRVCALHKGNVEILSDYKGVVYVSMDDSGGWRLLLAREITAAGIDVDLNDTL